MTVNIQSVVQGKNYHLEFKGQNLQQQQYIIRSTVYKQNVDNVIDESTHIIIGMNKSMN